MKRKQRCIDLQIEPCLCLTSLRTQLVFCITPFKHCSIFPPSSSICKPFFLNLIYISLKCRQMSKKTKHIRMWRSVFSSSVVIWAFCFVTCGSQHIRHISASTYSQSDSWIQWWMFDNEYIILAHISSWIVLALTPELITDSVHAQIENHCCPPEDWDGTAAKLLLMSSKRNDKRIMAKFLDWWSSGILYVVVRLYPHWSKHNINCISL